MDIIPEEFTDDEWEREVLRADELAAIEPDEPMLVELAQISTQLSNLRPLLSAQQRKILPDLVNDALSNVDIAKKHHVSPSTVGKAKKNPSVRRMVALLHRQNNLYRGPSEQQRAHMLWLIAKREYQKKPSVAIKAIDTLNKQSGLYRPDGGLDASGVTINVREFTVVNAPGDTTEREVHDAKPPVIEGTFTPVTVETPDD